MKRRIGLGLLAMLLILCLFASIYTLTDHKGQTIRPLSVSVLALRDGMPYPEATALLGKYHASYTSIRYPYSVTWRLLSGPELTVWFKRKEHKPTDINLNVLPADTEAYYAELDGWFGNVVLFSPEENNLLWVQIGMGILGLGACIGLLCYLQIRSRRIQRK